MRIMLAGAVAFVLSAGLIRAVLSSPRISARAVAVPVADRWHTTPTPSFGGVPMFVAFAVALVVSGGFGDRLGRSLLLGAAVVFVVGLLDDLRDISPRAKLVGQFTGALLVTTTAVAAMPLSLAPVIVVWCVLISNSVNLIDNMDGLAGSTTVVSLAVVLPVVWAAGQEGLAVAAAAVLGAVLGFLIFNLSPAKIFMGDAGSLWLGLVLASAVAFADYGDRPLVPLVVVTVVAIPLLDTGTVVLSRLRGGFSILRGGSDHLSHRLVRRGLTARQSVRLLAALAGLSGLLGVGQPFLSTPVWLASVGLLWAGLIGFAAAMLRIPVYES